MNALLSSLRQSLDKSGLGYEEGTSSEIKAPRFISSQTKEIYRPKMVSRLSRIPPRHIRPNALQKNISRPIAPHRIIHRPYAPHMNARRSYKPHGPPRHIYGPFRRPSTFRPQGTRHTNAHYYVYPRSFLHDSHVSMPY